MSDKSEAISYHIASRNMARAEHFRPIWLFKCRLREASFCSKAWGDKENFSTPLPGRRVGDMGFSSPFFRGLAKQTRCVLHICALVTCFASPVFGPVVASPPKRSACPKQAGFLMAPQTCAHKCMCSAGKKCEAPLFINAKGWRRTVVAPAACRSDMAAKEVCEEQPLSACEPER